MNLRPDETVCFCLISSNSHFYNFNTQITPNLLSSFHPWFFLRVPGDDFQSIPYGLSNMRLQVEHVLKSIHDVNDLLPSLAPDSVLSFI